MEIISIAISISLVISVLIIAHIFFKKIKKLYDLTNQNDKIMLLHLMDEHMRLLDTGHSLFAKEVEDLMNIYKKRIADYEKRNNNKQ